MPEVSPEQRRFAKLLGARIARFRGAMKISQKTFAEQVRLDRSYVSRIERGMVGFSIFHLYAIAKALQMPVSELVDFKVPPVIESDQKPRSGRPPKRDKG